MAERFEGRAEQHGNGTVVEVPFDPKQRFGRVRAPVRATVNGHEFRTTLASMGGRVLLGLNREVRDAAGVAAGDRVAVALELDQEPRVIDVPADFAAALDAEPALRAAFESLSYTHRREYVRWITEAKRAETRRARVEKSTELLRKGVRTPDASS